MGAGVSLRVEIDEDRFPTGCGEGGREVDGGGRFADAALLVENRNLSHFLLPGLFRSCRTIRGTYNPINLSRTSATGDLPRSRHRRAFLPFIVEYFQA
jgi:hypothetical protein